MSTEKAGFELVEAELNAHGFSLRGRGRTGRAAGFAERTSVARRLRRALGRLGPFFAGFGRYLSTRVDLFPPLDCLELAESREDLIEVTPAADVRALLAAEVGAELESELPLVENTPCRRDLFHQWHRGRLTNGDRILVKLVRPDSEARVATDIERLRLLRELRLESREGEVMSLEEAISDFIETVGRKLDLRTEWRALTDLAESRATGEIDPDGWVVPKLHRVLCSRRVLVMETLGGRSLTSIRSRGRGAGDGHLARRLCSLWLRLALFCGIFPEEALGENIRLLEDNRLALVGASFGRLDERARKNLLDYITAVARHEPDRAHEALLAETRRARDGNTGALRMRFRMTEPYRQGGWGVEARTPRFADGLFVHWNEASKAGFPPSSSHLLAFYRGCFELDAVARHLAPHRDAFEEGVSDVRLFAAATALRKTVAPTEQRGRLEQVIPLWDELFSRLSEVSRRLQEGGMAIRIEPAREGSRDGLAPTPWSVVATLLMLLASIAVLRARLDSAGFLSFRLEAAAAAVYACVGMWLLRLVVRRER